MMARHICVSLVALLMACSEQTTSKPEGASPVVKFKEPDAFYKLLSKSGGDLPVRSLSPEELFAESSVVGIGHVLHVRDGMVIRYKSAKVPTSLYTLAIEIKLDSMAKGDPSNTTVYLEYVHGSALSAETYDINKPKEALLVFLVPAIWRESDEIEYLDADRGRPKGAPIYRLTTPEGLLIEQDGGLLKPLSAGDSSGDDLFGTAKTLVEVEQALFGREEVPSEGASSGTSETSESDKQN